MNPLYTVNPVVSVNPVMSVTPATPMYMAPPPVIVNNTPPPNCVAVGPQSSRLTCPSCHAQVNTRIKNRIRVKAHLTCLGLFLLGFWPCCLIPYCMDSCINAEHFCPSCNSFLGTYRH